jgi:RNA-directed DNA polymerase
VFGDRESGAYLAKFAWTKIVRHHLVKGQSSPDDPTLTQYWVDRRHKGPPLPMDRTSLHLLLMQRGRCPACQGLCCTPTVSPYAHKSGNSGWRPPARR